MENENQKPSNKTPEELAELKNKNSNSDESVSQGKVNPKSEIEEKAAKISREHDFTHTHPTHANHKKFGADHEPRAF